MYSAHIHTQKNVPKKSSMRIDNAFQNGAPRVDFNEAMMDICR